jgi:hypothetical protein
MKDTISVSIIFPYVFIMAEQTKFNGMQFVKTRPTKLCLIFFRFQLVCIINVHSLQTELQRQQSNNATK